MNFHNSLDFARQQDAADELRSYRDAFVFPKKNGKDALYFCGNSLGLQPKKAREYVIAELDYWQEYAVEGHFKGEKPWSQYHVRTANPSAAIFGASPKEIVVMNSLTVNIHLLMVSFYRPTKNRFKIIMEAGAFPSDQYAIETQIKWHGLDPKEAIVEVSPRDGEHCLRTEDILETISLHGEQLALVFFGGMNYYTGQLFDMPAIARAGHGVGAYVGFDLAHVAGNVPVQLHDWGVDFALWCTYKYMNSGPGAPSGIFIHAKHFTNTTLPRLAGWWGYDEPTRFLMQKGFVPMEGAAGWQLSNAPALAFAAHLASLHLFEAVGMDSLRKKSITLTGYLEFLLDELIAAGKPFRIITPRNAAERGCQLSLDTGHYGKRLYNYLLENGVVCDWREPNVTRLAPTPFYNSFEDVFHLAALLEKFAISV